MILAAIKPVTDLTFPTAFRLHGRREVHERRGFCVPVGSPGPGQAGTEEPEVGLHHLHLLPLVLPPHAWAPACPPRLPVEAARQEQPETQEDIRAPAAYRLSVLNRSELWWNEKKKEWGGGGGGVKGAGTPGRDMSSADKRRRRVSKQICEL